MTTSLLGLKSVVVRSSLAASRVAGSAARSIRETPSFAGLRENVERPHRVAAYEFAWLEGNQILEIQSGEQGFIIREPIALGKTS